MKILRIGYSGGLKFTLLKNIEDVRRYVDNFSTDMNNSGKPVGIGDLSLLSKEAQSVLLKFVEEGVQSIECYAGRDNVSPVLMSRFDRIEKNDEIKVGFDDFESFVKQQEEKEYSDAVIEREFVAKSSQYLDSFVTYRKLSRGMKTRVGHLL